MCGIVGYVGERPCRELLLRGLERLEYRGYDSAGLSLLADGQIQSVRAVGNLSYLREAVTSGPSQEARAASTVALADAGPTIGIGHTRWATHGRVTEDNAHPHFDTAGRIHIVLNGIVENHAALRERLSAAGAQFTSETDAEVVAHLIAEHYDGNLLEAVRAAYMDLCGHYAFVAISADDPDLLVAARKECPLIVGVGEGESFVASAIPAFLRETRRVQLVGDDEVVAISASGAEFIDAGSGAILDREVTEIDWDDEAAEKGGYETFMLKEINEQPDAVAETIADRVATGSVDLGDIGITDDELRELRRIVIVACGTSYHAGLVGRYAIEEWGRVPVEMDIASEYRYRNPVVDERDLVIGITQSGETADTLAAMRLARSRGARVLALTNVMGSQATRDADGVLFTRAGIEISVAATKTFVAQAACMYLIGLKLAEVRGTLPPDRLAALTEGLRQIPHQIGELVGPADQRAQEIAERFFAESDFCLYLGRHIGLPVCLEGALKLKEISYIPADAYAAGEMKHGPIALLSERTPVVCVATDAPVLDKVLSNVAEVRARGAHVIAVATEGSPEVEGTAEAIMRVPRSDWLLQPILAIVPLQLLAYRVARARGLNVDQPRNLAKTVTVE
ncbi:MAG: glutamine--fructose-6-phosphate transaminase (isomerizing) [Actinobacteria bacterium]|nr:MAG: glutamine--fructose-6-phosphate transaminase (isomerizing) [Actinomycetota bacterium]TMM12725.1 MAG: glutamine--fructose-6-phosphate transaminase (isomerizing) [Actinomycetota bacterium]